MRTVFGVLLVAATPLFAQTVELGDGETIQFDVPANSAATSVQVVDVAVESGDAAFSIGEGSDCAGASIASGSTCRRT